jgi:hypothetical protein
VRDSSEAGSTDWTTLSRELVVESRFARHAPFGTQVERMLRSAALSAQSPDGGIMILRGNGSIALAVIFAASAGVGWLLASDESLSERERVRLAAAARGMVPEFSWLDPIAGTMPPVDELERNPLYNPSGITLPPESRRALLRYVTHTNAEIVELSEQIAAQQLEILDSRMLAGAAIHHDPAAPYQGRPGTTRVVRALKGIGTFETTIDHAEFPSFGAMARARVQLQRDAMQHAVTVFREATAGGASESGR